MNEKNFLPENSQKTVKNFYDNFNFRDMVLGNEAGEPPELLKQFFAKDIEYIQNQLNHDKKVLEVGCGFGQLLKELSKISKNVVGIDFSDLQLRQAKEDLKENKNIELVKMKAEEMGFKDESFDISMCMNCSLGNMPGIEGSVIKEMQRVTKTGGKIIVRVFADSDEVKNAQLENYRRLKLDNIQDDGHAVHTTSGFYSRRFSKNEMQNMFKAAGLDCAITQDCDAGYLVVAKK